MSGRRAGPSPPVTDDVPGDLTAAIVDIQQLAVRYALAVDSRDIEGIGRVFVPDVQWGMQIGRAAVSEWFAASFNDVGVTIHLVANHVVTIIDDVTATGVVYCREEVQLRPSGWRAGMLQYWDDYQKVDGEWLFLQRRVHRWYTRPLAASGAPSETPEGWVLGAGAPARTPCPMLSQDGKTSPELETE
jgi:hypothetical protein